MKTDSVKPKEDFISYDNSININLSINIKFNMNDVRSLGLSDSKKIVKKDVTDKYNGNFNVKKLASKADFEKRFF